jgi:hypothetical protein
VRTLITRGEARIANRSTLGYLTVPPLWSKYRLVLSLSLRLPMKKRNVFLLPPLASPVNHATHLQVCSALHSIYGTKHALPLEENRRNGYFAKCR